MRQAWMVVAAGLIAGGLAVAHPAKAEDDLAAGAGYGEDNLSFERWCSEIQRYPAARCAAKSADDQTAFEQTRERLQEIEVQHARQQRQDRDFRKQWDAHRTMTPLPKL